jgi:hypothetical protein
VASGCPLGVALIVAGVWQTVFFVVLRGWPVNLIGRRPPLTESWCEFSYRLPGTRPGMCITRTVIRFSMT